MVSRREAGWLFLSNRVSEDEIYVGQESSKQRSMKNGMR